jgi:hypothetical protein
VSNLLGTIFGSDGATVESRHEERRKAAGQRWHEWPSEDLYTRSGFIVDKASGALFRRVEHVVFASGVAPDDETDIAGFYDAGSDLVFFVRSASPSTVDELEQQNEAKAAAQRERGRAHSEFVRDQPKRTLRLSDIDPDGHKMLTIRESATLLLDHGCKLYSEAGHFVVEIPEMLNPDGNLHLEAMQNVARAARVLRAAGPMVLDELEKPKQTTPLDERLPDRHAAAFGGLA